MNFYDERLLSFEVELLPEWNERRKVIATQFHGGLRALPCILPPDLGESFASLYPFTLSSPEVRDGLMKALNDVGIAAICPREFCVPEGTLKGKKLGNGPASLQRAHSLLSRTLCLPCSPEVTDEDVQQCIAAIQQYFRSGTLYTLSPEISFIVNSHQRTVSSLVHEEVVACQLLEKDELSLLVMLLDAHPYYCPYEIALSCLTGDAPETWKKKIEAADEQVLPELLHDVRQVLSSCRIKTLQCWVDILSILETGYLVRVSTKKAVLRQK